MLKQTLFRHSRSIAKVQVAQIPPRPSPAIATLITLYVATTLSMSPAKVNAMETAYVVRQDTMDRIVRIEQEDIPELTVGLSQSGSEAASGIVDIMDQMENLITEVQENEYKENVNQILDNIETQIDMIRKMTT